MLKHYSIFTLCLLILNINSLLPPEKREELWNKYLKRINPDSFQKGEDSFSADYLGATYTYNVDKVNEILTKYNFPQNFNFLEEHNITAIIKDQKSCGCCWSHAATSSLAYRFKLTGLDLDLSPQDGLSCYLQDCDAGNYLISPEFNLIKNGTVTEQCFPFVSGDGKFIPGCPTECEDGTEFKKYYSQNAFKTEGTISQDNYYDIITLIIDILITKGPVVSGIEVYDDFQKICQDSQKCHDEVYTYDGYSQYGGGHAITMVGYGFMNNKFYWLIQNSWGPNACDKGFVKIEFGQVNVEKIAFSEPYIEEQRPPTEIPVSIKEIDAACNLKVEVGNEYLNDWKNSLEIKFKSASNGRIFNYQCSVLSSNIKGNQLNCYIDNWDYYNFQGTYDFYSYDSLGKENKFFLDTSKMNSFNFYGNYYLYTLFGSAQYFYVSEKGSKLIFPYNPNYADEEKAPFIYPYNEPNKYLSNCKRQKYYNMNTGYFFIICELTENEVLYFQENAVKEMVYNIYCNYFDTSGTYALKLDKTKYPIFRVKSAFLEKIAQIDYNTEFSLITQIEGTISDSMDGIFIGLAHIEYNRENSTYFIECNTGTPEDKYEKYSIVCYFNVQRTETKLYDNIYILPYFFPYEVRNPYEVILNGIIKVSNDSSPETDPAPESDTDITPQSDTDIINPSDTSEPHHSSTDDTTEGNYLGLSLIFTILIILII